MGTTEESIMRLLTRTMIALGFVGATVVGTASPSLAQGVYFEGPGVGFSIGLDRSLLMIEQRGLGPASRRPGVFVASMDGTRNEALALVRRLRRHWQVDVDLEARGLGAQMKAADKSGAAWLVLLGEEERERGEVVLKDLRGGAQHTIEPGAGLGAV